MSSAVQAMIAESNRKTAAVRKQVFAKKANDQQHHLNLFKHCEVLIGIYHNVPSLRNDNNMRAAVRELETAMALSRRRLEL